MIDPAIRVYDDLAAGSFTNYTTSFPIYVQGKHEFQGGNVYILIGDAKRNIVQAVNGERIYVQGQCTLGIRATTETIRSNVYEDVLTILKAAGRGYTFENERELPADNKQLFRMLIDIKMNLSS